VAADLNSALTISASGMTAQTTRLRVIAQNIANQDTTGSSPGADPYQRRTITFQSKLNQALGADTVNVKSIDKDQAEFPKRYDPANPAADPKGYVKLPNVNSFVELMDMREAERSYGANLAVMRSSRTMMTRTIDLLK
jgi:flagellar basal-body rod protein FlgC